MRRDPIKKFENMVRRYHLKLGSRFPHATENYLKGSVDFVLFAEERVREILHRRGVPVPFHWAYYGFGRKVFKLIRKGKLERVPEVIEDAIKRKGLSREVLLEITEALSER